MMITKEHRKAVREKYSVDSESLFKAAWRKVLQYNRDADIEDLGNLFDIYDVIVSELVNNSKSRFYIYG